MLHGFETHSSYLISVLKYSRILDDAVSFAFVSFRKFAALCPGFLSPMTLRLVSGANAWQYVVGIWNVRIGRAKVVRCTLVDKETMVRIFLSRLGAVFSA